LIFTVTRKISLPFLLDYSSWLLRHALNFYKCTSVYGGPGSSVGIATELQSGRSGIESRWGRDFPPVRTGPGAHPAFGKMGTGCLSGVNCDRGVLLTTHPLLVPRSWKGRAITLPTLWATPGLSREQFTFTVFYMSLCLSIH